MAFIQRASFAAGAKFVAEGDLRLQLKQPLAHKGSDTRYNVSLYVLKFSPSELMIALYQNITYLVFLLEM